MNRLHQIAQAVTRRHFLRNCNAGLGAMAFGSLLEQDGYASPATRDGDSPNLSKPHFAGKAKHVIYLHMAGSPPQQDLFDHKPKLNELNMQPCPDHLLEILQKERLPFIDLKARRPKLLGTPYRFRQHGDSARRGGELFLKVTNWKKQQGVAGQNLLSPT